MSARWKRCGDRASVVAVARDFPGFVWRSAAAVLVLLWGVGCGGCSPAYVLQGAVQQARILASREPIEEVLATGSLSPQQRSKIEIVPEVRRYATDVLGFDVGGAYSDFAEVPPGALVWVVSASEKTRLQARTWWFPIVGAVPYKGFFEEDEARALAAELGREGLDTWVRPTQAFSTLGWFDDPVLSSWLDRDRVQLADLVLHELMHRDVWIEDHAPFNESLATFVAAQATIDFFERRGAADEAAAARQAWQETLAASRRWGSNVAELQAVYAAGERGEISGDEILRQREVIFQRIDPKGRVNNALILGRWDYLRDLDRFACAFGSTKADLRVALDRVAAGARESEDPFASLGPCEAGRTTPDAADQ